MTGFRVTFVFVTLGLSFVFLIVAGNQHSLDGKIDKRRRDVQGFPLPSSVSVPSGQPPVPPPSTDQTNTEDSKDNTSLTSLPNETSTFNISTAETTTTTEVPAAELPKDGAEAEEKHSSMTIFFILLVVGALIGLILRFTKFGNWRTEEAFSPTIFFLILLPPIIFESGYNLHKGNFFQNIGSILVFAIFGTVISAMVIGGGVYLLGKAQVATELDVVESFAFGSMISAVDPVATLAIFQAIEVDPILYMLVFGESVLNDAVSIVLTKTMLEFDKVVTISAAAAVFQAIGFFCLMFFASAAIGAACGLLSAIVLKVIDLRKTPSLEFGMMLIFAYLPYGLAEGIQLSGIMAILFCAIVMSHYTHLNLSPVTQITVQQTFRTIAFISETCVFAYLGLAISSFQHDVRPSFVIWSIALCLIGRAVNIFPLSFMLNYFREHKITRKMQFIMWFSGLRGAVAFAISLHLEFEDEKRHILVTTTLIIVLFTLVCLGGSTMPLLKFLSEKKSKVKKKRRNKVEVYLSKTKEMGDALDSEHLSELTEEEYEVNFVKPHLKGFMKLDAKYLIPFFTRRFTQQEVREGRNQIDHLTNKWYKDVRAAPSESENEDEVGDNDEESSMIANTQ